MIRRRQPSWRVRAPVVGGVVALAAVVVIGSIVFLGWPGTERNPRPAQTTVAPPRIPIAVSLSHREEGPILPGVPQTFSIHALGEAPISAVELWAGNERAAVQLADSGSPAMSARLGWVPSQPGETVLVARGIDATGRVSQSNPVRVAVADGSASAALPRAALAVSLVEPVLPLALPAVQLTVNDCVVEVAISGDEATSGFSVYALAPMGLAFLPVGSIGANLTETTIQVPAVGGSTTFVIGAFDDAVEVLAPPMPVAVPDECGNDGWSGGVQLDGGHLIGGVSVDRAYLYLQQGAAAAVRVPADPTGFVEAGTDGTLDFGAHLPALNATDPIHLEAYGWQHGALLHLGSGTWQKPAGSSSGGGGGGGQNLAPMEPYFAAGTLSTLDAVIPTVVPGPAPCGKEFCGVDLLVKQNDVVWPTAGVPSPVRTLRWSTQMPAVTHVVWQVLPYAPPSGVDLDPPFLVDQGVIVVEPGVTGGDFTIDFAKYLDTQVSITELGDPSNYESTLDPIFAIPGLPAAPTPSPTPKPGGGSGFAQIPIGQVIPSTLANQAYVRVVPLQGTTPTFASNSVRFDFVPPPEPIMIDAPEVIGINEGAYDVSWSFTPPKAADPKYARCAVVTGFTPGYVPPPPIWPETYAIGDVKCYEPPDDGGGVFDVIEDGFEAFVNLVEDVWEGISDGYEWIQDQIVKAILVAVPCQQIADDDVCEAIARTALSVALAAMGMPPTIPDYGALMNGLKGDLRTLVLEAAKSQLPGLAEACGLAEGGAAVSSKVATCEALVDEAIDEVIAQVEAEVSAAAGKATGKGYPGVIFVPDPRGMYQPPIVDMTLTRTNDPVLPSVCTATAAMTSTKFDYEYWELIAGWPKLAKGDVSGEPFLPGSFTIPPLQPGESITRTVWLSQPATWFPSQDAWEYWYYYEGIANPNRAYVLLTAGASLEFEVRGNCMPTSTKGPHVLTASAVDG